MSPLLLNILLPDNENDIWKYWINKLTGIPNAHIVGEHLCLPDYNADHPTLEIFSYNEMPFCATPQLNRCGIAHLAFEVDDVDKTLDKLLKAGGNQIEEIIRTEYAGAKKQYLCTPLIARETLWGCRAGFESHIRFIIIKR